MNRFPKISVIVAVYNTEKYLEQCLSSICNQTFSDIEIIIVNDGSTDNSLAICEKYAQGDDRVVLYSQSNKGLLGARLSGIRLAKGKYCQFVDSDDYLAEDACEQLFGLMEKSEADLLHFQSQPFDWLTFAPVNIKLLQPNMHIAYGYEAIELMCCHRTIGGWVWDKIYSTELVKKSVANVDVERLTMFEDEYLSFLFFLNSHHYRGVNTPPLYFYRYGDGISTNRKCDYNTFLEKVRAFDIIPSLMRIVEKEGKSEQYFEVLNDFKEHYDEVVIDALLQLSRKKEFLSGLQLLLKRSKGLALKKYAEECLNPHKLFRYIVCSLISFGRQKEHYRKKIAYQKNLKFLKQLLEQYEEGLLLFSSPCL